MVKCEFEYNPYLLTYSIRFNGQDPRINCCTEKYVTKPLWEWVMELPKIIYDEMNGFDFELIFSGTIRDFEMIKRAFSNVPASIDKVHFVHKSVLEDVQRKSEEIDELNEWLKDNKSKHFDYEKFLEANRDLFEGDYTYVVVYGRTLSQKLDHFRSVDVVESVRELDHTVLTNTPVVFCLSESYMNAFRQELPDLIQRMDIHYDQLFFMLDASLSETATIRTIQDHGVPKPQIVCGFEDQKILEYFHQVPQMEFVCASIQEYEEVQKRMEDCTQTGRAEGSVHSSEVHEQIQALEKRIESVQQTHLHLFGSSSYELPQYFVSIKSGLAKKINDWNNRKTKAVGEKAGCVEAEKFECYLHEEMDRFRALVKSASVRCCREIKNELLQSYEEAGEDLEFMPHEELQNFSFSGVIPELKSRFMEVYTPNTDAQNGDFFGLFKKGDQELQCIDVFYFEDWREKAREILFPIADAYMQSCGEKVAEYRYVFMKGLLDHLRDLEEDLNMKKSECSKQLSDEEKGLQYDEDWLSVFSSKLKQIERG